MRHMQIPKTSSTPPQATSRAHSIWAIAAFVAPTFIWAWGLGYAASQVKDSAPALNVALMITAGYAPSLTAIAIMACFGGWAALKAWFTRCLKWRVKRQLFALAFLPFDQEYFAQRGYRHG